MCSFYVSSLLDTAERDCRKVFVPGPPHCTQTECARLPMSLKGHLFPPCWTVIVQQQTCVLLCVSTGVRLHMRNRERQGRLRYVSQHDVSFLLCSAHIHRPTHASIGGLCHLLCCCIRHWIGRRKEDHPMEMLCSVISPFGFGSFSCML